MQSRFAALFLTLAAAVGSSQTPAESATPSIKIFHSQELDLTFSYPGEFTPVTTAAAPGKDESQPECVKSMFSAGSESKLGSSAVVISSIDGACPGVLKQAEQAASFTKEQILRQLKNYGTPKLTQEPYHYSIDGHPAAFTLGSAQQDAAPESGSPVITTYGAKACFLDKSSSHSSSKASGAVSDRVICFDFTTKHHDLLPTILAFTVKFGDGDPHPIVPGTALH